MQFWTKQLELRFNNDGRPIARDDKRFGIAQFMRDCILLRDTADRNSGCCAMLSRNELSCIVDYLVTM